MAACFLRIEAGIGPATLLLELEVLGAVVPVADLLGEPILDRRSGLVNPPQPPPTDFLEVLRHHLRNGVCDRFLLQVTGDPGTRGVRQQAVNVQFVGSQRTVVKIGRVVQVARLASRVQLHIQELLGNGAALATSRGTRVLQGMFQVEEHTRCRARIALVHQYRATA